MTSTASTFRLDDILLMKIQDVIPVFAVPMSIISLLIHFFYGIISIVLYVWLLVTLGKEWRKSKLSIPINFPIFSNAFVNICFYIINFVVCDIMEYPPFVEAFVDTSPSRFLGIVYYIAFIFNYCQFLIPLHTAIERLFFCLYGQTAFRSFKWFSVWFTLAAYLIAAGSCFFQARSKAYFTKYNNVYTNFETVAVFETPNMTGRLGFNQTIFICMLTILTLITFILLLSTSLLFKPIKKSSKDLLTQRQLIFHAYGAFVSTFGFSLYYYCGYFGGGLNDLSIMWIGKIIKPWCFNFSCFSNLYFTLLISPNLRTKLKKFILCRNNNTQQASSSHSLPIS